MKYKFYVIKNSALSHTIATFGCTQTVTVK